MASDLGTIRRVVATATDHGTAQRAASRLTDGGLREDEVVVVARGLREPGRITGRLSARDVAGRGGLLGAVVGVLVGSLLSGAGLLEPATGDGWVSLWSTVMGAVLGASSGLLGYGLTRGRRSVTVPGQIRADGYDVQVDAAVADRAVRLLRGDPVGGEPEPDGRAAARR
ncbi:general stress protein [Actinoplanes sp. NPDC023714]|uniref:general stress protein n=1 Tax=Actinoplanes sp. NPDC023714 TaxID=3154322 RepID=UPI0033CC1107